VVSGRKIVGLIVLVPTAAFVVGLLFGILPCYLFVPLGIPGRWCGFKSEPPHFVAQFWIGAAVGAGTILFLFLRPGRSRSPSS